MSVVAWVVSIIAIGQITATVVCESVQYKLTLGSGSPRGTRHFDARTPFKHALLPRLADRMNDRCIGLPWEVGWNAMRWANQTRESPPRPASSIGHDRIQHIEAHRRLAARRHCQQATLGRKIFWEDVNCRKSNNWAQLWFVARIRRSTAVDSVFLIWCLSAWSSLIIATNDMTLPLIPCKSSSDLLSLKSLELLARRWRLCKFDCALLSILAPNQVCLSSCHFGLAVNCKLVHLAVIRSATGWSFVCFSTTFGRCW